VITFSSEIGTAEEIARATEQIQAAGTAPSHEEVEKAKKEIELLTEVVKTLRGPPGRSGGEGAGNTGGSGGGRGEKGQGSGRGIPGIVGGAGPGEGKLAATQGDEAKAEAEYVRLAAEKALDELHKETGRGKRKGRP